MHLNNLYYLPPGNDPLHWLAHSKALVSGISYPLWSEGLLQIPPAPLALLGLFAKAFGDILGLKLFGALVLGLLPLSSYVLVNRMFGPRVGIIASAFVALTPILYEMWGYGMYPNLFGFSVLFLAFFTIINFTERRNVWWGVAASLMTILVMFSHHLTSIIFVATMAAWTALSALTKNRIRELAAVCLFSIAVFVAYRMIVPPEFDLSNSDAAALLAMSYSKFFWVFKSPAIFVVTVLCAGYGYYLIYKRQPGYSLLLISLVVSSFAVTYGLPLVGINLDPVRFLIFSVFGFSIGVAYLANQIAFEASVRSQSLVAKLSLKSMASLTVVAVLLGVTGYIGVGTSSRANDFVHEVEGITTARGDAYARGLVDWIKNNTGEKDVFVAEPYLAKIIMGLGERRVLEADDPAYLFMQGESTRAIAATILLHSNAEVFNPSVRIREQYPVQNYNPLVSLSEGGYSYTDIVYFSDGFWRVTVEEGGDEHIVSAYDVKTSESTGPLSVIYETSEVLFKRNIKIENDGVRLVFSAEPARPEVTLLNMKVYGWRPWSNNNLTDIQFDGTSITLIDGQVNARVTIANYAKVNCYLADPVYKQAGFWAMFNPEGEQITGEFFIPSQNNSRSNIQNAAEIIRQYNVSYFAVLNFAKDQEFFLETNGYKEVYSNSLATIYQTK